jgi:hypothetical protein
MILATRVAVWAEISVHIVKRVRVQPFTAVPGSLLVLPAWNRPNILAAPPAPFTPLGPGFVKLAMAPAVKQESDSGTQVNVFLVAAPAPQWQEMVKPGEEIGQGYFAEPGPMTTAPPSVLLTYQESDAPCYPPPPETG